MRSETPLPRLIERLLRSRAGRWGSALIGGLVLVALAAPLLAPHGLEPPTDRLAALGHPPLTVLDEVRLVDGEVLLADGVQWSDDELVLSRRDGVKRVPRARVLNPTSDGVRNHEFHLLGTDRLGRDVWARCVYGARTSLTVGVLAALLSLTLGALVGSSAAMSGRFVDGLIMRLVDGLLAIPTLVLVLVLSALLKPSIGILVLLIGGTSWMATSRLARAEILSVQQRDFILAARALGQTRRLILLNHLLPNALTPLLVDTSLRVGAVILTESALSFLGLGIPPDVPSWGGMIAHGRADLATLWWTSTFPGCAIVITVLAFNLFADGLRDALDPRS